MSNKITLGDEKVTIERTYAAPVEKVYEACTKPELLAQWMAPNVRWKRTQADVDLVVGGKINFTMRHSDGDEFEIPGTFLEIIENRRLSWRTLGPAAPNEIIMTVDLEPVGDGTALTLTLERLTVKEHIEGIGSSWGDVLNMLELFLQGNPPEYAED